LTNRIVARRHPPSDLSKVVGFDAVNLKADFHMTDKRIVMTTAGSVDEARRIAETLVDRKLAACVNIVPKVVSIYRWKGKVEEAEEWLLWVKTAAPFEPVRDAILEMHSYELPECLSISIEEGSEQYLKWLEDSSK